MNFKTSSFAAVSSSRLQRRAALLGLGLLAGMPLSAMAAATLYVVQGSGEFQSVVSAMSVTSQQALTMQWSTDQAAAAGGTWKVTNSANQVVASGETTPAPAPGKALRFSIPQAAFLKTSVSSSTKYNISIQPHDGVMVNMGAVSGNVVITQEPSTTTPPPVFGDSANYPVVEIITYNEIDALQPGADVTVKVTNKSNKVTDPAWLTVKDGNVLYKQSTGALSVPQLQPGASTTLSLHLNAMLPVAPTAAQQYTMWNASHDNNCGPVLNSVLDWRGASSDTPLDAHKESFLVKEGWSDYAKISPNLPVCSGTVCVKTCQIEKNVRAQLDGKVTGYAFQIGAYPRFGSGGKARLAVDAPETSFKSNTKITVASVNKLVTTIAAVRLIDQKAATMPQGLDTPIAAYMPSDWAPKSDYLKNLTFAQLLAQRSGIKDYGNVSMDYAQLKKFFTAAVDTKATTTCQGSAVQNPANPVNTTNQDRCYSNYNFAIMRVLLPKVAGYAEDVNTGTRPTTLANQFTAIVQQQVFNLVGQYNVTCKPPVGSTNYAFGYKWSNLNVKGTDFGDASLICGAAGIYLSVEDMSKVMMSLNARDGKILIANASKDLFAVMRNRYLGWDVDSNTELEKNGGWSANCDGNGDCDTVSTSVAQFGPVMGPRVPATLFINSKILGGGTAQTVLEKAYTDALYIK